MEVVQYHIHNGINSLFEMPIEVAKQLLPENLLPVEIVHGSGLIGVTLFSFSKSPVGPYQELVISLYVAPLMGIMKEHPHAAVYPLVVASSSKLARDHAIELWHLPHFNEDITIEFTESADGKTIQGKVVCSRGEPIVILTVSQLGMWKDTFKTYQSFQNDETGSYMGILDMKGSLNEHEENTGSIQLHKHRFFDLLDLSSMDTLPVREMWMKRGIESYHDLITLHNG